MSLKESKSQLRKSMKATLRQIPVEALQTQSHHIHQRLLQLDQFKAAKRIAIYMNMPHLEVQTNSIIKSCFDNNKLVYLPRIQNSPKADRKPSYLEMVRVPSYQDVLEMTPKGKYKLLEPESGVDILDENEQLDLILVPGVAFDGAKRRMGHGAGYYDEFLTNYFNTYNKAPFLVGLGLKQQLVGEVPTGTHDWTLDGLIIDDVVI